MRDSGVRTLRLPKLRTLWVRFRWEAADQTNRRQLRHVEQFLRSTTTRDRGRDRPVLFFNASPRIIKTNLNVGYGLLASCGLRATGVPARYAVCTRGLDPCILGTRRDDYAAAPPCKPCLRLSRDLSPFDLADPIDLDGTVLESIDAELQGSSMTDLESWSFDGLPLGWLCLPGLRWALRRHHLPDDEPIVRVYTETTHQDKVQPILQNGWKIVGIG